MRYKTIVMIRSAIVTPWQMIGALYRFKEDIVQEMSKLRSKK